MKKVSAWIQVIITSFFLLVFVTAAVFLAEQSFNHPEKPFNLSDLFIPIIGFLIVNALLIFGLINGIKKVRKEKPRILKEYTKPLSINLSGKIDYKEYRNLLLRGSFKRPYLFVFFGIFTLLLLSTIKNTGNTSGLNYPLVIMMISIFFIIPILTIRQAKKLYDSNKIFQETLEYHITNEEIHIKGTTVDAVQKWNHFFKMKDTKDFIMFFHGENIATLIQKKMFKPEDLNEFYEFIDSLDLKIEK